MDKNKLKKKVDTSAQKLKGKAQKAIGEYQMKKGETIKGGISKAKGELNVKIAEAKEKLSGKDDYADDNLSI